MKKLFVVAFLVVTFSTVAHASEITSGSLASVLELPDATGTIAGTTFAFNQPINGIPEYYSGPYAGQPTWGPASNITFTPDNSQADNPGFTLTGSFHATYTGAYYDITLGDFAVTAPSGKIIDAISIDMGNPVFNPTNLNAYNQYDIIWLNSFYATQGTPSISPALYSWQVGNSSIFYIQLRFWNNSGGDIGFDSATFHFHEASAVPIPSALFLFSPGLAGLIAIRRRFSK